VLVCTSNGFEFIIHRYHQILTYYVVLVELELFKCKFILKANANAKQILKIFYGGIQLPIVVVYLLSTYNNYQKCDLC
jgi:hypothetical protein